MPRPNVVVVFTDQQRWDCAGVHGNPLELMPAFDRMATRGTHCANAFTCQPVCGPARASIQTGRYASATGVWRNGLVLDPSATTLARCFAGAGYATGYIGKWHLSHEQAVPPAERGGYASWLGSNVPEFDTDAYSTTFYDDDRKAVKLPGYRVDALTDAGIRWIDARARQPFLLFLSYLEPHFQNHRDDYPAPVGYEERYRGRWMPTDLAALGGTAHQHIAGYYGMVKRLDEALARIQDALISLGIADDTVVLFTSDHGNHFKTRNDEYKRSAHDASIRVPTALTGGPFTGGGRIERLVSHVDLAPTLLDAAGIAVPPTMQGRSFLPLLGGRRAEWPEEVYVEISEAHVGRAVRTQRWKYAVAAPDGDGWAQARADVYRELHLYDLQADPFELRDLVHEPSHAAVRTVLRERLLKRMAEAGEAGARIEPAAAGKLHGQMRVTAAEARA